MLDHQIGGGTGKTLASVAAATDGAHAAKKVKEKSNTRNARPSARYGDGRNDSCEFTQDSGMRIGDVVKNSGNTVVRY
ncbi:MAG TPA: hypothetical protein VLQ47_11625 [Rhodoferax sp.]|nr:hypothetical protein [Rhodoferax sp.]